ncbi:MAG TPA: hypothetical protein VF310_16940 [Vicinamibacteria bacterium]
MKPIAGRVLLAAGLFLALALATALPAEAQCAMCRGALTGSAEGRAMSASFNRAILIMFFAPYLVVGTMAAVLFRRPLADRLARWRAARRPGRPPARR